MCELEYDDHDLPVPREFCEEARIELERQHGYYGEPYIAPWRLVQDFHTQQLADLSRIPPTYLGTQDDESD